MNDNKNYLMLNAEILKLILAYNCGSIISGHLAELVKIVAFSADILSLGNPSLFHTAIWASSVNKLRVSNPVLLGISGYNIYSSQINKLNFSNIFDISILIILPLV